MKILIIDIETAPNLAYVWGQWQQDVIGFEHEWYIIAFTARWLHGKAMTKALPDYKTWKTNRSDDYQITKEIRSFLNEADVVVAHNGDEFDFKRINARFLYHNITPPSPYKTVDTLKIARQKFAFNSNKLAHLAKHLGVGKKMETGGFQLWLDCMAGKTKAWKKMKHYCEHDGKIEHDVYLKMLPYMKSHPNHGAFDPDRPICPKCGSKKIQFRGYEVLQTTTYRRLHCQNCGGWARSHGREKDSSPKYVGL